MTIIGVVIAGALGSVLRYQIDRSVQRRIGSGFPLGILVVNVTGSLALGIVTGAAVHHAISTPWAVIAGTGFVGAYTTFSSFTFDIVRLAEDDRWRMSMLNAAVSLAGGIGAAAGGLALGALV